MGCSRVVAVERAQGAGTHVVPPAPKPQKVEQPHLVGGPGCRRYGDTAQQLVQLVVVTAGRSAFEQRVGQVERRSPPERYIFRQGFEDGLERVLHLVEQSRPACRRVPLPQEFRMGHGDGRVHALGLAQVLLDVLVDRHGGVQRGRVAEALPPRDEGLRLVHEQGDPVRRRRREGAECLLVQPDGAVEQVNRIPPAAQLDQRVAESVEHHRLHRHRTVREGLLVKHGGTFQPLELTVLCVPGELEGGQVDRGRDTHVTGRSMLHQPAKKIAGDVGVLLPAEVGEGVRVSEHGPLDDAGGSLIVHAAVRQILKRSVGGEQEREESVAGWSEEVGRSSFIERGKAPAARDGSPQQTLKCRYTGLLGRFTRHQHHQGLIWRVPPDGLG
jgi:hypothetical protein